MSGERPLTPEQVTAGIPERQFLVKAARQLERALARRRRMVKEFNALSDEIRVYRSQIHGLTTPLPGDTDEAIAGPPDGGER